MLTLRKNDLRTNLVNLESNSSFISSLYFVIIIILFVVALRIGISRITEQKKTLANIKNNQAIMLDKEKTLSQAKSDIIPIFYKQVSYALPTENPALISFSEIKNLLNFYLLPTEDYSIYLGGEPKDESTVSTNSVRLSIFGDMNYIISFLKDVENMVPLMVVDKLDIAAKENFLSAEVTISSFWSPFLQKPSKLDTPIQKITDQEKNTLTEVGKLKYEEIPTISAEPATQRENPFISP